MPGHLVGRLNEPQGQKRKADSHEEEPENLSRCLPASSSTETEKKDAKDDHAGQVHATAATKTGQEGKSTVEAKPIVQGDAPTAARDEQVDAIGQPGPRNPEGKYSKGELEWQNIGSGTFARTFIGAQRLRTTTKEGPRMEDVQKRVIRSCKTGNIIDECTPDDVPDEALHRWMISPEDIRVELIMKNAAKMFERKGPDIAERFSQPRVVQEAVMSSYDGVRLTPGWSLDLTREDPLTGLPWGMTRREVRTRVR